MPRIPILGAATAPDSSGNVFFEPYPIKATNDYWKHLAIVFNDTATRDSVYGAFDVPSDYVGTANVVIVWTTTATSGNAVWDFDYRAVGGDDAESLDQATAQESVTATDAAPASVANNRIVTTIALTAGNLAAGDTVEFLLARDGVAADTIAAAVTVHGVFFDYATS